jgi:hypothetical protein
MLHLHLPDAWRIELLHTPALRGTWLDALDARRERIRLVDWSSEKPSSNDIVLFPFVDLASSELMLKLPESVAIVAARSRTPRFPFGGRARFVRRASARVRHWVELGRDTSAPRDPDSFLGACLRSVESLS